ncbi:STBD1 protein, partial [Alcedo cyanopectus]|nr:STBD1 protein [Ceyx cyanopectus]
MEQPLPKPGAAECGEHPGDPCDSQGGDERAQAGQAGDGWCLMNLAGASDDECKDKNEEQPTQPAERRDLDQEEWEVVSEPLAWGDSGEAGGAEDSASTERERGDCPDGDSKSKRVVAVPPLCQTTRVTFRVHYFTHSAGQLLGVTGDHERLGRWQRYVPLRHERDGFWARAVSLPADATLRWKFILVEDGKVRRWEECGNRTLVTQHEEQVVHQWWGYH